jgi:pyruvate dehydrogenase E1 component
MVENLSDDQIKKLRRGGHDYKKVYAAYAAAVAHKGQPTVILAHTVKGWTLGTGAEARNMTHQKKKLDQEELKKFRDTLELPIPDKKIPEAPLFHPGMDSPEVRYLLERRRALGGCIPKRIVRSKPLPPVAAKTFAEFDGGTGENQAVSTTMVFGKLVRNLIRDPNYGKRVVPIIPDEARTFGMEVLFREVGIYQPFGQKYDPVDSKLVLSYTEKPDGQLLEEGITEAGAMASFAAASTAYSTWGYPLIPFFIFYSMFGFQRVGDQIWAYGDQRGKGFLLGATAGRTTLTGEGLQHCDGQSLHNAMAVPNCRAYDPAFAYEVGVLVRDGIRRMYGGPNEDCFYYLALYNENYPQPPMPEGVEEGIVRGMYRYRAAPEPRSHRAQILASGPMVLHALEAQTMLADHHDVAADVWSVPGWKQLRDDALEAERWNRLHPSEPARTPYVTEQLEGTDGPIVAVTDWVKAVPDSIARFVPQPYVVLGTDGYGFSDVRAALRRHFEVDAAHVTVGVLQGLARTGDLKGEVVADAIRRYEIDPDTQDPRLA